MQDMLVMCMLATFYQCAVCAGFGSTACCQCCSHRQCYCTLLNFLGICPQQSLTGSDLNWALRSALILIPDKMCMRYLGFALLLWFPGVLHAQHAAQSCRAPRLHHGYFVPEQEIYAHETKLTYGCDNRHKPAVEGWWATSTCQNGKWLPEPQCIDEEACFPPDIPHAKYTESLDGWYKANHTIRITCDEGYEHKDWDATAKCVNGTWFSVPVCEKGATSCGEPPKIPHAIIIHQTYQKVFAEDTKVKYECQHGYTVKEGDDKKSIYCIQGNWTEVPTCLKKTTPGTGHSGSTVGGTDGGHTTSAGSGAQPAGGDRETRPGTGHSGSTVGGTDGGHTTSAGSGAQPADRETRPGTGHSGSTVGGTGGGHTTSAGSGTQPAGTGHGGGASGSSTETRDGGSSTTSGGDASEITPPTIPIINCGRRPNIPNGEVLRENRMMLKYQCASFYKLVGSDTVMCYNNATWSQLPICKEAFCKLDPGRYGYTIEISATRFLDEGKMIYIPCIWNHYSSAVLCTQGRIVFSQCCRNYDWQYGRC